MHGILEISIRGEKMELHPLGGLYLKNLNALLIADLHIGKIEHFRKEGLAVPKVAQQENFKNLNTLVETFAPKTIYLLGDLFHSSKNQEWESFSNWLDQQSALVELIVGNHDTHDFKSLPHDKIEITHEREIGEFSLSHEPKEDSKKFNICGHVHPAVIIRGKGNFVAKSTCFAQFDNQLILPAFGVFTGTHKLDIRSCNHIYLNTPNEVIKFK